MQIHLFHRFNLARLMLSRHQMVYQLISACKTFSRNAAWAALDAAEEVSRSIVGSSDVTSKTCWPGEGFGAIWTGIPKSLGGRGKLWIGDAIDNG